ncbi:SDR family NAD(P)-dependent oxidoreductase [Pantoea sp. LMR881]|uniref:SDR family NAD(P)-dependent oxidoreductase n=1 Tax=Pantoea sp. LMR881 TaxID=3014336 RepID=UPI003FA6D11E
MADSVCEQGGQAKWLVVDLAKARAIFAFVEEITAEGEHLFGRAGYNAGINRRGPFIDLSEEDWHITFTVNLDAIFHMCRAVLPHMIAQGEGAIVNTASQWGLHPAPGHIAYNTSKTAVAATTHHKLYVLTPCVPANRIPRARKQPGA